VHGSNVGQRIVELRCVELVKIRVPNVTKTLFSYPWSCDVLYVLYLKTFLSGVRVTCHHIRDIKHILTAPDQNRLDQVKVILACIWNVLGLNLGPDTVCPNQFVCCSLSFHANAGIVP
jgi:hypothetical protein